MDTRQTAVSTFDRFLKIDHDSFGKRLEKGQGREPRICSVLDPAKTTIQSIM